MAGVAEENRRRLAMVLVLIGCGLMLAGGALVLQHRHQMQVAQGFQGRPASLETTKLAQTIRQVLFWLLLLVGLFSVSSFAFLRWSRRFRRWMLREPKPPTDAEDVWAMHRAPDEE
jgi:uncharacterized membrane protein YidH (DUF202 family)